MVDFAKLVARAGSREAREAGVTYRTGNLGRLSLWVMLAAMVLSAVALWQAMDAAGRVAVAERELAQLSHRVMAKPSQGSDDPLRAEVHELGARVNDLAVIIEGPFSHLRQSNEESLEALTQRLAQLEQKVAARATKSASTPVAQYVESPSLAANSFDSGWVINLISLSSEKDAQEQMQRLRKAGVRVELQQAEHDGKSWYRLRVPGFSSYEGAKAYIETVEKQTGVKNAWVAKE